MPFLFEMAKTAEGMEVRIPEAASPAVALPKNDLLFMIIVLICECLKLCRRTPDSYQVVADRHLPVAKDKH